MREVLVTGPAAPEVAEAADMLASEVHVRRSSSFFEHLAALNARRQAEGEPPFPVVEADENLNSEDLLEMVEAGIIPATIADQPVVLTLQPIFPDLRIHDDIVLAEGGSYAWAFRKGSPKLAEQVNAFVKISKKGTKLGNILLNPYTKDTAAGRRAAALLPDDEGAGAARILHVGNRLHQSDALQRGRPAASARTCRAGLRRSVAGRLGSS